MTKKFDLVAIGTGSGASAVASACRAGGWQVAIIDSRPFGGTCALRGCDPKKVLVGASEVIDWSRRMKGKGVNGDAVRIEWPELMRFKRSFTEPVPRHQEEGLTRTATIMVRGRVDTREQPHCPVEVEAGQPLNDRLLRFRSHVGAVASIHAGGSVGRRIKYSMAWLQLTGSTASPASSGIKPRDSGSEPGCLVHYGCRQGKCVLVCGTCLVLLTVSPIARYWGQMSAQGGRRKRCGNYDCNADPGMEPLQVHDH